MMLSAILLACAQPESPGPTGLAPLEALEAEAPAAVDGDATPETLSVTSREGDEYDQAHGWGFVDAPIADVIAALQDPDAGVDRRRMVSWETEYDTAKEYDLSYTVANHSEEVIPVDFDVTWGHGASLDDPDGAATLWSKTDGTEFIPLLEGWAQVIPWEDSVAVQIIYHLDTVSSSTEDLEVFLGDFYGSIRALAHGEPLPVYSDA